MKRNEFRVKKTFNTNSISERPNKNDPNDASLFDITGKIKLTTPMRSIASFLSIIALICLLVIDNHLIVGIVCLLPATFYALSYFTGERFSRDFFGMTNTLFLSVML